MDKSYYFFKWFDDEIVDERDLKIERQKNTIFKLKMRLSAQEDG